ncbi:MAG TPA: transposase, partial [Bdellovibrio sp.]|nr:transposase [Bdellovibrio sp.]
SAKRLLKGSWFTTKMIKLDRTSALNSEKPYPLSLSLIPKEMSTELDKKPKKVRNFRKNQSKGKPAKEPKEPAGKCIMIRLFPDASQRKTMNGWVGTSRWTYNKVIYAQQKKGNKPALDLTDYGIVKDLRQTFVKKKNSNNEENFKDTPWVLDTPAAIRDGGLMDVVKAYRSNLAKPGNNNFTLHFKKKNAPSDSIVVPKTCYTKRGVFYPRFFGNKPIKSAKRLPVELEYEARIVRNHLGHFYFCIPKKLDKYDGPSRNKIISIDPGVRTFCTGYDSDGLVVEVGESDISKIESLCHEYDDLQSECSHPTTRHRKRYKLKRSGRRKQRRIRNKVDELHKKLSKWLCENYNIILLPKFETQKMVSRNQRKINSRTARNMMTLSHYRFRTRLMNKAREYPNCRVILCGEEYTSKTCGECGFLHHKLGSSKVFKCPGCKQESDRDRNGSRNILLKNY